MIGTQLESNKQRMGLVALSDGLHRRLHLTTRKRNEAMKPPPAACARNLCNSCIWILQLPSEAAYSRCRSSGAWGFFVGGCSTKMSRRWRCETSQTRMAESGGERDTLQTLRAGRSLLTVATAYGVRWLQHRFPLRQRCFVGGCSAKRPHSSCSFLAEEWFCGVHSPALHSPALHSSADSFA